MAGYGSITVTVTVNECPHLNGWYNAIPFWIFTKKVFVCTDCGAVLHGKGLAEWKQKKENKSE